MTRAQPLLVALVLVACGREAAVDAPRGAAPASAEADPTRVAAAAPAVEPFAPNDEASVRAALAQAGRDIGEHACFSWPRTFPRVVVVGGFAHDRGCEPEGVFVDRTFHADNLSAAGLATRGFERSGLAAKETNARAWVDEVVHAFGGGFVRSSHTAFTIEGSPPFEPVHVRADKIGGVVVEGWTQLPSGMADESTFVRVVYRFAKDGTLAVEERNRFTVPGDVLRAAESKSGG